MDAVALTDPKEDAMNESALATLVSLRTPDYHDKARGERPCEVCGREVAADKAHWVETEQGEYPIGSTCVRKVRAAGLVVR